MKNCKGKGEKMKSGGAVPGRSEMDEHRRRMRNHMDAKAAKAMNVGAMMGYK